MSDNSIKTASIDRLFQNVQQYRTSEEFKRMIEFYIRFPYIGAYNAALVQQQRPGATFVLSPSSWLRKYNRRIKRDARPVVDYLSIKIRNNKFDIMSSETTVHSKFE